MAINNTGMQTYNANSIVIQPVSNQTIIIQKGANTNTITRSEGNNLTKSKTYTLYHPGTGRPTITIGTKGFRMICCNAAGWELEPVSILFDKIISVSIITSYGVGYRSFNINSSTIERPSMIRSYEIQMRDNANEIYDMIMDGYKKSRTKKNDILGIN